MIPESRPPTPGYPTIRMRRFAQNPRVRELVQDVRLAAGNLILPLFVRSGEGIRRPIAALPGHFQLSIDQLAPKFAERSS